MVGFGSTDVVELRLAHHLYPGCLLKTYWPTKLLHDDLRLTYSITKQVSNSCSCIAAVSNCAPEPQDSYAEVAGKKGKGSCPQVAERGEVHRSLRLRADFEVDGEVAASPGISRIGWVGSNKVAGWGSEQYEHVNISCGNRLLLNSMDTYARESVGYSLAHKGVLASARSFS